MHPESSPPPAGQGPRAGTPEPRAEHSRDQGQEEPSQSQLPHVPEVGPPDVPVAHVLVVEHQPQLPRPVHAPHVVDVAHASVLSQAMRYQSQSAHVPVSGP